MKKMDISTLSGDTKKNSIYPVNRNVRQDIAVIGISVTLPKAENSIEFWRNICEGCDLVRDIPVNRQEILDEYFDLDQPNKYIKAGYLDDVYGFDHKFFNMSSRDAELTDPNQRLFL